MRSPIDAIVDRVVGRLFGQSSGDSRRYRRERLAREKREKAHKIPAGSPIKKLINKLRSHPPPVSPEECRKLIGLHLSLQEVERDYQASQRDFLRAETRAATSEQRAAERAVFLEQHRERHKLWKQSFEQERLLWDQHRDQRRLLREAMQAVIEDPRPEEPMMTTIITEPQVQQAITRLTFHCSQLLYTIEEETEEKLAAYHAMRTSVDRANPSFPSYREPTLLSEPSGIVTKSWGNTTMEVIDTSPLLQKLILSPSVIAIGIGVTLIYGAGGCAKAQANSALNRLMMWSESEQPLDRK